MTNCLTVHLPHSTLHLDSDNPSALEKLSTFCKEELGGYHSTDNTNEITVDSIEEKQLHKLRSLLSELGIF